MFIGKGIPWMYNGENTEIPVFLITLEALI
jgi:hypothetical protein